MAADDSKYRILVRSDDAGRAVFGAMAFSSELIARATMNLFAKKYPEREFQVVKR